MDLGILPFLPGQTALAGNATIGATDKQELEGREYMIPDLDYSKSIPIPRAFYGSGGADRQKRIRIVRNSTGCLIYPRQLVCLKGGTYPGQVDGFGFLDGMEVYPADEFLPTSGVAPNDLFYITTEGCAEVLTELTNNFTAIVAHTAGANSGAGNWLVAKTAAASTGATSQAALTAITAGRVSMAAYVATTALACNIQNRIGLALSACTSQGTNQPVLCFVKRW